MEVFSHKRQILELQDDLDRLRDLLKETESDTRKYQNQYQDSMDLIEKLTANNVDLKIKVSAFSAEVLFKSKYIVMLTYRGLLQLDSIKAAHAFLSSAQSSLQRHSEAVDAELKDTKLQLETEKLARCDDSRKFREELDQKECELQRLRLDAENSENERRLLSRTYNASLKVSVVRGMGKLPTSRIKEHVSLYGESTNVFAVVRTLCTFHYITCTGMCAAH